MLMETRMISLLGSQMILRFVVSLCRIHILLDSPQDVELVHARLTTLENLRLERFAAHLQHLCLRENFLSHLDPQLFHLLTKLEELDLYDNRLKSVGDALNALTELA